MLLSIYIGFLLFGKGFGNKEILLSMGDICRNIELLEYMLCVFYFSGFYWEVV